MRPEAVPLALRFPGFDAGAGDGRQVAESGADVDVGLRARGSAVPARGPDFARGIGCRRRSRRGRCSPSSRRSGGSARGGSERRSNSCRPGNSGGDRRPGSSRGRSPGRGRASSRTGRAASRTLRCSGSWGRRRPTRRCRCESSEGTSEPRPEQPPRTTGVEGVPARRAQGPREAERHSATPSRPGKEAAFGPDLALSTVPSTTRLGLFARCRGRGAEIERARAVG
jgi:hypothetical protein